MEMLHRLTGIYKSTLEVYEDKIIIKKKGAAHFFIQGSLKGDKIIYIKDITTIDQKDATTFTSGYIQFTVAGSREREGGYYDAAKDENALAYVEKEKNEVAKRIVETINRIKSEYSNGPKQSSNADELRKFKQLADEGVITQEEFEAKKKQILGI